MSLNLRNTKASSPTYDHRSSYSEKPVVLVVEDQDDSRSEMRQVLELNGYHVIKTDNGQDAVKRGRYVYPDLLLVDLDMPGMTGVEFAKYFLSRRSDVPVIFMSGFGESQELGSLSGAIEFLPKPFSLSELAGKTIRLMSVKGT